MEQRNININQLVAEYLTFDANTSAADQIELLDALMADLVPPPGTEVVVFHWYRDANCYDCGNPAAFSAPHMYGVGRMTSASPETHFCGVCAANHAAEGETIVRIMDPVAATVDNPGWID